MSDETLYFTEDGYPADQNAGEKVEVIDLADQNEVICEEVPVENSKNDNKDCNEEHVESPTTGEAYTFKCVFCGQLLTPNDNPKLLECLHNACGNCLGHKICEISDGEKGKFSLFLNKFTYTVFICRQCGVSFVWCYL